MTLLKKLENINETTEILKILNFNKEILTEVENGYYFDVKKLKKKTITELENLLKHNSETISHKLANDKSSIENIATDKLVTNKTEAKTANRIEGDQINKKIVKTNEIISETNNTKFVVTPKFNSDYNSDFFKSQEKSTSMLKFLNAKKKYLRNSDTVILKNEDCLLENCIST